MKRRKWCSFHFFFYIKKLQCLSIWIHWQKFHVFLPKWIFLWRNGFMLDVRYVSCESSLFLHQIKLFIWCYPKKKNNLLIWFFFTLCLIFQASQNILRLHINGEIFGEIYVTPVFNDELHVDGLKRKVLPCIVGDNCGFQGYVHCAELSPPTVPIKTHYMKVQIYIKLKPKLAPWFSTYWFVWISHIITHLMFSLKSFSKWQDPPLQLSIDSSSASEIEEDSDGVWSIVGGKVVWIYLFWFCSCCSLPPVMDMVIYWSYKIIHFSFLFVLIYLKSLNGTNARNTNILLSFWVNHSDLPEVLDHFLSVKLMLVEMFALHSTCIHLISVPFWSGILAKAGILSKNFLLGCYFVGCVWPGCEQRNGGFLL